MQDLSYAVKEKVTEDHNVIDEAIKEEAEVRWSRDGFPGYLGLATDPGLGLHGILDPRWNRLQTERGQSAEFEDQRLSWKGTTSSRIRSV